MEKAKGDADTASSELLALRDAHASIARELEQSGTHLSKETKRAEQAVAQKQALQEDNKGLLEQLEEVRGRIGQLAEGRESLGETIAEQKKRIAELEVSWLRMSYRSERLVTNWTCHCCLSDADSNDWRGIRRHERGERHPDNGKRCSRTGKA